MFKNLYIFHVINNNLIYYEYGITNNTKFVLKLFKLKFKYLQMRYIVPNF